MKARWRSVDCEHQEAIEVRRQWMKVLGLDDEEIEQHLANSFDLSLVDELGELSAAIDLCTARSGDGVGNR